MVIFINFFRRLRERLRGTNGLLVIFLTLLLILIGVLSFSRLEGWGWLDALYVTIITITTVGYGDLSPQTVNGRIFAIFFTFIAIGIGGYAITSFAAYLVESGAAKKAKTLRKRRMNRIEKLNNHIIVCGADAIGKRIAEEFYLAKMPFVIVDSDEEKLKDALLYSHPDYFQQKIQSIVDIENVDLSEFENRTIAELGEMLGTPYLLDDPTEDHVLLQAGVDRARGLIAAMPDERDNLAIVVGARALGNRRNNPDLQIMARVESGRFYSKMTLSGADAIRIPAVMSGLEMATHMMFPEIGNWWYSLVNLGNSHAPRILQVAASEKPEWIGQTVSSIHQIADTITAAVKRNEQFISPPPANLTIEKDDILIVLAKTE